MRRRHRLRVAVDQFLADTRQVQREWVTPYLYHFEDSEAIRHLFRVAASLDSMVVGEPQILGQLKSAYALAKEHGAVSGFLDTLLTRAFNVAKRVRSETEIGENAVSVSYAAVELAREIFGSLRDKKVMIVGAGKMSELAARHLRRSGATQIFVTNRTPRARRGNGASSSTARSWTTRASSRFLPEVDIVIASSGAPHYIIVRDDMKKVLEARRNKPMFLIDIAVPRNIEPSVNELDNVFLYDIDDLQKVVETNLQGRMTSAEEAEAIIREEVERMVARLKAREVAPTIVSLQEQLEKLRAAELARMRGKFGALTPEQEQALEAFTQEHDEQDRPRAHFRTAATGRRSRTAITSSPPSERFSGWAIEHADHRLARLATGSVAGALDPGPAGELGRASRRIEIIHTTGDKITDVALSKVGTKGLFTKEIEEALLAGAIDLAVHSLKDMPTDLPAGLTLAAIPEREDPRDALVGRDAGGAGARRARRHQFVAPRRAASRAYGRIWRSKTFAAIWIRACASWMKASTTPSCWPRPDCGAWAGRIASRSCLIPQVMCPAVGQGALAVETRDDGGAAFQIARRLEHAETRIAVTAERAVLASLGGGCQVPIGAYATVDRQPAVPVARSSYHRTARR